MVYCLEDFSRREGRPAPRGPPFLARMAPTDSARQEWASATVIEGRDRNRKAARFLRRNHGGASWDKSEHRSTAYIRTFLKNLRTLLRVDVAASRRDIHDGEPVRCHGKL